MTIGNETQGSICGLLEAVSDGLMAERAVRVVVVPRRYTVLFNSPRQQRSNRE